MKTNNVKTPTPSDPSAMVERRHFLTRLTTVALGVGSISACRDSANQEAVRNPPTPTPAPAPATSYSTSFKSTENPISEGGKWINGRSPHTGNAWNNVQTNVAGAFPASFEVRGGDDCIAHLNPSFITFNANQYAEGTVHRAAGYSAQHEIELHLRFSIASGSARGYEIYWSTNGRLFIVRWNGPAFSWDWLVKTNLGLANDGDVLRAEIRGTAITVHRNGAQVLTANDSTWATGQPGVGFTCPSGGTLTSYGWKNWRAGNL